MSQKSTASSYLSSPVIQIILKQKKDNRKKQCNHESITIIYWLSHQYVHDQRYKEDYYTGDYWFDKRIFSGS